MSFFFLQSVLIIQARYRESSTIDVMARAAESAAVTALRNVMQRVQQASDRANRPISQVVP